MAGQPGRCWFSELVEKTCLRFLTTAREWDIKFIIFFHGLFFIMKTKSYSFSGAFGHTGFFLEILSRLQGTPSALQGIRIAEVMALIKTIFEKHLKECEGDDVVATERTLREFFDVHNGHGILDEIGPAPVEKGSEDVSSPTPPTKPHSIKGEDEPEAKDPAKKKKSKKERREERSKNPRTKKGGRAKGVGNTKRAAYVGAPHLRIALPAHLFSGSFCPSCHVGRLQQTAARECLRFVAEALLSPLLLDVERLRCSSCRQIFEAELPRKFSGEETLCKATAEAAALSLLLRYGLGFPDHRLETLQGWQHAPFSDANQWAISNKLWETLGSLERHLHKVAANATIREVDDCSMRVVEFQRAIAAEVEKAQAQGVDPKAVRTGMNVTSYVAHFEGHAYRVFFIGREHQGEREHGLASLRDVGRPPVVRVSDAASKGQAVKPFPEKNEKGFTPSGKTREKNQPQRGQQSVIQAFCLAHLVLTLEAARPGFRAEVGAFLALLSDVFALDEKTRGMTPEARLEFHQRHSAPLMGAFQALLESELRGNLKAEPNGPYGKVLRYANNHWQGFTEFLRTPGVPLTTNEVELANKFTKLHHKNSLSFQTAHGAQVGAFAMSLIATAEGMKENPLEYLTAIIRYRSLITDENAGDWMPHTFRASVVEAEKELAPQGNSDGYRIRHRKLRIQDEATGHRLIPLPGAKEQHSAASHN